TDSLGRAVYAFRLDNYKGAFNSVYIPVMLRSIGYAAATAALCLAIGYPIAYYIARYGGRYRNVPIAAPVIPFVVHHLVRTCAWVALLSDDGLVNSVAKDMGLTETGFRMLNTPWSVIGGLVYGYLVFMTLPVYASIERIDRSVIEAGKDLFGTPLR